MRLDPFIRGQKQPSELILHAEVYPSALMAGEEVFSKPSFPTWLQKLASMNKNHRLVHELSAKVRRVTTCGQDHPRDQLGSDRLTTRGLRPSFS